MMIFPSLKRLLARNHPVCMTWLALGSLPIIEFAAQIHRQNAQNLSRPSTSPALVLDLQHGLWDKSAIHTAVGLTAQQIPVIARCAGSQAHHLAYALDAGAASVLIPMVESADQARQAVQGSHYPPAGLRSAGGVRPLLAGVPAMLAAGQEVSVGIMIETVHGVENVEQIVRVPGIDYVFIGTGDLALSRGIADAGQSAAQLEQDCQRVLAASRAAGLPCGRYTANATAAQAAFAQGFQLAVIASDIDVIRDGFLQALGHDYNNPYRHPEPAQYAG